VSGAGIAFSGGAVEDGLQMVNQFTAPRLGDGLQAVEEFHRHVGSVGHLVDGIAVQGLIDL